MLQGPGDCRRILSSRRRSSFLAVCSRGRASVLVLFRLADDAVVSLLCVPDAAAGGSDDWAKGVAGIQLSYTIELPGGDGYGFDLPASYIPQVGHHQMEAVRVFANYVGSMSNVTSNTSS